MPDRNPLDEVRARIGDRYAVERELGRGGMGAVYLARDLRLDRPVALKVLPEEFADDPALRERFLRETRTAAAFSHPNIVPVHAIEERDGLLAFAMGYVEGESLAERVGRSGPLDLRGTVRLLQDVGYALAYAHGRGVVHRDIKPDNIMIERATGRALLMDFGIARPIAAEPVGVSGLTRVGEVVGTPEYMSPEQATAEPLDGRTDIYSLGLVALFAVSGSRPISGTSAAQVLAKQLTEMPPSAASLRPDLPGSVCAAIDRCVAKSREDRFASAEALVDAIDVAQVSAPEIPAAIRMFAQEIEMVALLFMFMAGFVWLFLETTAGHTTVTVSLPVIVMAAAALTRLSSTFGSARRLAVLGFSAPDILTGLRRVAEERDAARAQLRADPAIRRRRRAQVRAALATIGASAVAVWFATRHRVEVGPSQYRVGLASTITLIAAFVAAGASFVVLARSPLRRNVAEQLYRLFALGPLGRALVTLSTRGVLEREALRAPVAPRARAESPEERLAALEKRLAALEKGPAS